MNPLKAIIVKHRLAKIEASLNGETNPGREEFLVKQSSLFSSVEMRREISKSGCWLETRYGHRFYCEGEHAAKDAATLAIAAIKKMINEH